MNVVKIHCVDLIRRVLCGMIRKILCWSMKTRVLRGHGKGYTLWVWQARWYVGMVGRVLCGYDKEGTV